jgi:hypothetical protein
MNLFCLLWAPLFYFFWVSLKPLNVNNPGGPGALLLGSVCALVRLTSPWVSPGEFGFSRWLSALVDTVGLPALLPFLFFVLFSALKIIPSPGNPPGFALIWLIPEGILRSVSRSGRREPVFLVLVPLLWTALALGIPFFARLLLTGKGNRWLRGACALFGMAALPLAAVTCYWAFFCQRLSLGWILFAVTLLPAIFYLVEAVTKSRQWAKDVVYQIIL